MEKRIKDCLDQDFSPNGMTAKEIAKVIGTSDIKQVEHIVQDLFNKGSLIKNTHGGQPDIRFRIQNSESRTIPFWTVSEKMEDIEPKILPLVQALNVSGLVHTFSSCQGHFDQYDRFNDHHKANVRFDPEDGFSEYDIEKFLSYIITKFNELHSFTPVTCTAHKLYAPINPDEDKEVDYVYVLELIPFYQGVSPEEKRRDIDQAILKTTKIVSGCS
ncbi:MAG: hypothetical protein WD607_00655 [Candidatus Paceibacterota bacterium]